MNIPPVAIQLVAIAAIIIASLIAYQLGIRLINRYVSLRARESEPPTPQLLVVRRRLYTLSALLRNALKYGLLFTAIYLILVVTVDWQRLVAFLTGVGIFGIVIAFGSQAMLKDVVAGLFILFEGQYGVGDIVNVRVTGFDVFGAVQELGLRVTTIADLAGSIHFIPNGSILGVQRFPSGSVSYRLEFRLPAGEQETIKEAVRKASGEWDGQSFVLKAPWVESVTKVEGGHALIVAVAVLPGQDWVIERIGEAIGSGLERALSLSEKPGFSSYAVDAEALVKFRQGGMSAL